MDKNNIVSIITLVIVVAVLVFSVVAFTSKTATTTVSAVNSQQDTIEVYGQGKVFIQPDIAYIVFGVETKNKDPKVAQDENEELMSGLMKALESAGISRENIRTVDYNVDKHYTYSHYIVSTLVEVSLNEVERASEIINTASEAGSNEFRSIRFDIIDRQAAYNEAIDMALERANEKANNIADKTGRKVEDVVSVVEDSSTTPYWYSSATNFVASSSSYSDTGGGSISSGQLEISATVNVVYRLR